MGGIAKSPWILHYDGSSCNGCDIETLACLTPLFDVERLGVVNTGNPKHADIFLVTGAVNEQSKAVIQNLYEQMPEPKAVVAVGACACTGGIFRECYNICGGIDHVIPVDVYVPGCAARPEAIIDGVVKAIEVLDRKQRAMKANAGQIDQIVYLPADKSDAPQIMALQRVAFEPDQELYGSEENVPMLMQSVAELTEEFSKSRFVKAVVNGKTIASARGYQIDQTVLVSGVMVHAYFRRRGNKSEGTIGWLGRQGYQTFKVEAASPAVTWVHLQKERK